LPARLKAGIGLWEQATPKDITRSAMIKTKEKVVRFSPPPNAKALVRWPLESS
jgi:hypothetical protein